MRGDTLDQFLTAATVLLMDSSCSLHWADYTSHLPDPPNLSTMRDFCEHRLTALQIHPTVKKSDKVDAGSRLSLGIEQLSLRSTTYGKPRGIPVLSARKSTRSIYQCSTFMGWTVDRRMSTVHKKQLCNNCLGRGHSTDTCRSKRTCRECSGRHHTFLHRPSQSTITTNENPKTTSATCSIARSPSTS